jgi:hypothetical protein
MVAKCTGGETLASSIKWRGLGCGWSSGLNDKEYLPCCIYVAQWILLVNNRRQGFVGPTWHDIVARVDMIKII